MNILIACEESQRVCEAFRKRGHNAYSCDIIDPSGGHPEWHIKCDVLEILNPKIHTDAYGITHSEIYFTTMDGMAHIITPKWDLIVAHPPCTHLAVSGALRFAAKREDGRQREAIEFFCKMLTADCDRICVENPVNIISGEYCQKWFPDLVEKYGLPIKPTQTIHPWMFGHPESKKTCLWLKNLPQLVPTNILELPECGHWENQTKDGQNKPMVNGKWLRYKDPETAKNRSKTYPGIADAIGEQWGNL